jgi:Voltage gated chloride channel
VQIGSALASAFGQWTRMPENRMRILVACGAAGGIAATFNAPLTGVFFGVEIILREFSVDALFTVMLSAMLADAIAIPFLGDHRFLTGFPLAISLAHPRDYLLVAVLAVVAGLDRQRNRGSRPHAGQHQPPGRKHPGIRPARPDPAGARPRPHPRRRRPSQRAHIRPGAVSSTREVRRAYQPRATGRRDAHLPRAPWPRVSCPAQPSFTGKRLPLTAATPASLTRSMPCWHSTSCTAGQGALRQLSTYDRPEDEEPPPGIITQTLGRRRLAARRRFGPTPRSGASGVDGLAVAQLPDVWEYCSPVTLSIRVRQPGRHRRGLRWRRARVACRLDGHFRHRRRGRSSEARRAQGGGCATARPRHPPRG